jgi:hypothetical protein
MSIKSLPKPSYLLKSIKDVAALFVVVVAADDATLNVIWERLLVAAGPMNACTVVVVAISHNHGIHLAVTVVAHNAMLVVERGGVRKMNGGEVVGACLQVLRNSKHFTSIHFDSIVSPK